MGTQGLVGSSPHQGDPTSTTMQGPGGAEGGTGKLPMEPVPLECWASWHGLRPAAVLAAWGPETHPGPCSPMGEVGGGAEPKPPPPAPEI